MYEAVEVFVNIFQAFAITYYLIKCLGVKEGKNRKCIYNRSYSNSSVS